MADTANTRPAGLSADRDPLLTALAWLVGLPALIALEMLGILYLTGVLS